jgi:DNA repair exonuclease SbcCD ATPase subunit
VRLARLTLEDIGCFERREIDFAPLTVVHGENRTGKSTFVHALYFALFGLHLNRRLKPPDLCRHGRAAGSTVLCFQNGATELRLRRDTTGLRALQVRDEGASTWQPIDLAEPVELRDHTGADAELTALTSFFREGELIFFLQEVPRYNKTLLESLLRDENLQLVRWKLRKALGHAESERRLLQGVAPSRPPSGGAQSAELGRRIAALEERYAAAEAEIARLLETTAAGMDANAMRVKMLREQHAVRLAEHGSLAARRGTLGSIDDLESEERRLAGEERDLEARVGRAHEGANEGPHHASRKEDLLRERGRHEQQASELARRIERLRGVGAEAACPTCEQPVPAARLAGLCAELEARVAEARRARQSCDEQLAAMDTAERALAVTRGRLGEVRRKLGEARTIDEQLTALAKVVESGRQELDSLESRTTGLADLEAALSRRRELETGRTKLREEIASAKAALLRHEEDERVAVESAKRLAVAARNVQICDVAHRALENATQSLYRRLLGKVQESLERWRPTFDFLSGFDDIHLTADQLLPIIRARGVQYKLDQMSKSERLFLYLMMKTAVGDALGHLGVFVLDDPADGLDPRRKELLARLLGRIGQERQIVVTTNDPAFAEMMGGCRVEL